MRTGSLVRKAARKTRGPVRRTVERVSRGRRSAAPQGTRERILTAALEAFAAAGYDGAKTRDIAAKAGVNQGLITYHFAGKEALWRAAVDEVFAELGQSFADANAMLDTVDARTRLRLMIRHFVRFSASRPELHRLMIQEGTNDGPRLRWLVDRHVRPLYETSLELIRAAQAEGVVAPRLPAVHLQYIFLGAAAHAFAVAPEFHRLTGIDPTDPAAVEAHADTLTALFLGEAR